MEDWSFIYKESVTLHIITTSYLGPTLHMLN